MPPSAVVTVMMVVPAPTAVTLPVASTVATAEALLLHVTFWLAASVGVMVAVRGFAAALGQGRSVLFSDTLSTGRLRPR